MYRGIKRRVKILIPITGIGVGVSQGYLNYLQIQEMLRNKNISKDVNKDKGIDSKPSPKS
jgi:hypothetical protein